MKITTTLKSILLSAVLSCTLGASLIQPNFPTPGVIQGTFLTKVSAYDHLLYVDGNQVLDTEFDGVGTTFEIPVDAGLLDIVLYVKNTGLSYDLTTWHLELILLGVNHWRLETEDLNILFGPISRIEGVEPDRYDVDVELKWFGTPVPEPGTGALLMLGLVGAWSVWRKKHAGSN